ncbi:MAG: SDR family oxidoreductase [Bacteroidia bacterium]|nr:SDR family oxidoreductase [Bacteroidia bacterium]
MAGYNLLAGKTGIITGALDPGSIAWQVALRAREEGATFILTNAPVALRFGSLRDLSEQTNSEIVPCDVSVQDDVDKLIQTAKERFGKIDFLLHSIGMSLNVRKNRPYTDLNYDFLHRTYDISAISFHRILQAALQQDVFNEWASVVALSYLAAQRTFGKYNDMAESKALLESIARSFGYHLGRLKKVRVNTISQSPTPTTAGSGVSGFDKMILYAEKMSPLGNATASECADYVISLFSDLTRKVTMQNLYHDGGFSMVGVTEEVLEALPTE